MRIQGENLSDSVSILRSDPKYMGANRQELRSEVRAKNAKAGRSKARFIRGVIRSSHGDMMKAEERLYNYNISLNKNLPCDMGTRAERKRERLSVK